MIIAASFLATEFEKLKEHWRKNVNLDESKTGTGEGLGGVKANQKGIEDSLGGVFCLIDLHKKEILNQIPLDAPAGFFIEKNKLHILNMRLHQLYIVDLTYGKVERKLFHNYFNCLHSLNKTSEGYLISSTGTDLITEISNDGKILFEWWATEQGFNKTPEGNIRVLDKNELHDQFVYPTLHQTTHVNSAYPESESSILATLFHQGQLIRINKKEKSYKILLDGLKCPHRVSKRNNGWTISNTKANEVLLLNNKFEVERIISENFDWVQDSFVHDEYVILADANNNRIVTFSLEENKIIDEFKYPINWRIYQIEKYYAK